MLTSDRWLPLQPGDAISIVAPAAGTMAAWDELNQACALIRAAGFVPEFDKNMFEENAALQAACNFAASDEARYRFFVHALESDSRVIWCFRGGYGSDRVAEQLFRHGIQSSSPKLLVGFSDITLLQHYTRIHWNWPGLHASVLRQLAANTVKSEHINQLWGLLQGDISSVSLLLEKMNDAAHAAGTIRAEIVGGNLTVIQSGMGTPWEMPRDGIVFFEDVNEVPYRIARILQQWLSSRWLHNVKAVIFGDFTGEAVDQGRMDDVLLDFAVRFPHPVLRCRGIGHGESNHPLPVGVPATLLLDEVSTLTVRL